MEKDMTGLTFEKLKRRKTETRKEAHFMRVWKMSVVFIVGKDIFFFFFESFLRQRHI